MLQKCCKRASTCFTSKEFINRSFRPFHHQLHTMCKLREPTGLSCPEAYQWATIPSIAQYYTTPPITPCLAYCQPTSLIMCHLGQLISQPFCPTITTLLGPPHNPYYPTHASQPFYASPSTVLPYTCLSGPNYLQLITKRHPHTWP